MAPSPAGEPPTSNSVDGALPTSQDAGDVDLDDSKMGGNDNDRNGPPKRGAHQVEIDPAIDPLADQFNQDNASAQDVAESIAAASTDTMLDTARAAIEAIGKPPAKNAKKSR